MMSDNSDISSVSATTIDKNKKETGILYNSTMNRKWEEEKNNMQILKMGFSVNLQNVRLKKTRKKSETSGVKRSPDDRATSLWSSHVSAMEEIRSVYKTYVYLHFRRLTHVQRRVSYLGAVTCGDITQRENRHVLSSVHPANTQPPLGHPLHHGDVVFTGKIKDGNH